MLHADIPTLFLTAIATSFLLSLSLGVFARERGMEALKPWAVALLFHTGAYILWALRGTIPDALSIIGANTFESIFVALWIKSLSEFRQRPLPSWVIVLPVALTVVVFGSFLQDLRMRILLGNPILAFQMATMIFLLRRQGNEHAGDGRSLLMFSMFITLGITVIRLLAVLFDPGQVTSLTSRSPLQTLIFLTGTVVPLVGSLGLVLMMKERSDALIAEGERTLTAIVNSVDESVAMLTPDGTLVRMNARGAERLHTTPENLVGKSLTELMPSSVAGPRIAAMHRVASTQNAEHMVDHRAGRSFRTSIYPVPGHLDRVVIYATDITESLAAEQALKRSEAHFRAYFERSMVGMVSIGHTGELREANAAMCRMLGYEADELLGRDWFALTYEEDRTQNLSLFRRVLVGELDEYVIDKRLMHKDGHLIDTFVAARCVRRADGQVDYLVGLVQDITDRNRATQALATQLAQQQALNHKLEEAQNQLLQSEKMASIGQLAAGVAHELNNPIGFVLSNLGSLQHYLDDYMGIIDAYRQVDTALASQSPALTVAQRLIATKDYPYLIEDTRQLMAESREGLERVRKIVQDLKDFSRVGESNWQWSDLQSGLESTLNIVWNELKYKCTVTKDYASLPRIRCLPSQLNQVFMNLLVNAAQAIPEKGEIHISTRMLGEDQVQVIIRDSGKGIPPDHLKRIFDPFFTTKPVGQGTGLGLSIAWGIIGKHHGSITVDSAVGTGTTFTITLPVDPPEDTQEKADRPAANTPPTTLSE